MPAPPGRPLATGEDVFDPRGIMTAARALRNVETAVSMSVEAAETAAPQVMAADTAGRAAESVPAAGRNVFRPSSSWYSQIPWRI